MKIDDVAEWLHIAKQDLYAAKVLNDQARKPFEIIGPQCCPNRKCPVKFPHILTANHRSLSAKYLFAFDEVSPTPSE